MGMAAREGTAALAPDNFYTQGTGYRRDGQGVLELFQLFVGHLWEL